MLSEPSARGHEHVLGEGWRCAVLGSPIGHSLSPVLHEAAYDALGLVGWRYGRYSVGGPGELSLAAFLSGLGERWRGLSLTMPLKEDALACAATVSDEARLVGAANTLIRRPPTAAALLGAAGGPVAPGGPGASGVSEGPGAPGAPGAPQAEWTAYSTDAYGLRQALVEAGVSVPQRCLILGAGATARSALLAVSELGGRDVRFAVREDVREETAALADTLGLVLSVGRLAEVSSYVGDADLVISTLPTGTDLPLDAVTFAPDTVALDVVYGGWPTPLARWANAGGARVVSGREMLLHQACAQVELMTGREAPVEAMRTALYAVT